MPYGLILKLGPYVIIALLLGLYLDKRDDLARSVEQCNADKLLAIADAEALARQTIEAGFAERIRQLEKNAIGKLKAAMIV